MDMSNALSDGVEAAIRTHKVIAIVRGVKPELLLQTAQALEAGGIRLMEITFDHRSPGGIQDTLRGISLLRERMGDRLRLGAGTVLSVREAEEACAAGAAYIISPNADREVIRRTKELGMLSLPGAMTPTEAVVAHQAGADFVKIFPIGVLGSGYLKQLTAPLPHIPFLAVGGVDGSNARAYLEAGAAGVGVGSSLTQAAWLREGRFDRMEEAARQLVRQLSDSGPLR